MPASVHALLMTDVVDSTELTRRLGDQAAADWWAEHDEMSRALLPVWRGREIDKSDGMLLLFANVTDALHYALAYLDGLRELPVPVQVRVGLHRAAVQLRHTPAAAVARGAKPLEVDGLAKPTVARVMALAGGGQVLVTQSARDGLGPDLPAGWCWQTCGHWMFKGLGEPLALHAVVAAGQAGPNRPPGGLHGNEKSWQVTRSREGWIALKEIPSNLPHLASSFVGRLQEQALLIQQLAQGRLVTLLGMGGMGKTRLALQVAASQRDAYPDGVWLVDLSALREPALVAAEMAQALGLREEPGRAMLPALQAHLAARRVLIVLDNCEHLLQAAAELVHALLQAAPALRVLATSREALRVPGETVVPLAPLPVPPPDEARADSMASSPAVALFVARAASHNAHFALTQDIAASVCQLVRRLEGIPLAIELAAARVRALSVADILARLHDRFRLLSGSARVLQPRQQALRALVDWSHDLLNEPERVLFARLAVFRGGFDLAAVEAVCADEPLMSEDMLDLLSSLVDKSLVLAEHGARGTRYRLLDTLREYAQEKLAVRDDAQDLAQRHLQYFFALAKRINAGRQTAEQAQWLHRAEADADNLRAALALPLEGGADPILAVKMAVAMLGVWLLRGRASEGRQAVRAALALPAVQAMDMARAHGLYVGAALAGAQGDHAEALRMLQACLALRRSLQRSVDVAATLSTLALTRLQVGDAAAARRDESEALALFRAAGDRIGEAISLLHLGQIAAHDARADVAQQSLRASLALAVEVGHLEVQAEAELNLGMVAWEAAQDLPSGAPARAAAIETLRAHVQRSAATCREAGDARGQAMAAWWQSRLAWWSDQDLPAASPAAAWHAAAGGLAGALRDFQRFGLRAELIAALEDAAGLLSAVAPDGPCAQQDRAQALAWAMAADAARARACLPRPPRAQARWRRAWPLLQGRLDGASLADAGAGEDDLAPLDLKDAVAAAQRWLDELAVPPKTPAAATAGASSASPAAVAGAGPAPQTGDFGG